MSIAPTNESNTDSQTASSAAEIIKKLPPKNLPPIPKASELDLSLLDTTPPAIRLSMLAKGGGTAVRFSDPEYDNFAMGSLDGIAAILIGISILRDQENPRQTLKQVKGWSYIISGTQLLFLSFHRGLLKSGLCALAGVSRLSPPAFAFSALIDFINASIDLYTASEELEFEGWLDARLKEIEHLQQRIKHIHLETERLDKILSEKKQRLKALGSASGLNLDLKTEIDYLDQQITSLNNQKSRLENRVEKTKGEIACRSRVYCHTGLSSGTDINSHRKSIVVKKLNEHYFSDIHEYTRKPDDNDHKVDRLIQQKLEQNYYRAVRNLVIKTVVLVGLTLAALATFGFPPLAAAGAILTTIGMVMYGAEFAIRAKNRFFPSAPPVAPQPAPAPVSANTKSASGNNFLADNILNATNMAANNVCRIL